MADPTLQFGATDADKIYKDLDSNDDFVFQINNVKVATMTETAVDTEPALKVEGNVQAIRLEIDQATAPSTVTDRLYNVSGDLFWNGNNLNQSTAGSIEDVDNSTSVTTEATSETLIFRTNNAERVRIESGGDVGIGTDQPEGVLDVQGLGSNVFIGVTAFQFDISRGNLGLGVTNPNAQLHMERTIQLNDYQHLDDTVNKLYAVSGDLYWNQVALSGGAGGSFIQDDVNDSCRVETTTSDEIVLKTSADVGGANGNRIHMTAEGHLIPQDNAVFDLGTTANRFRDLYLSGNSINMDGTILAADNNDFTVRTNGVQRLIVDNDGAVGIGTDNPATNAHGLHIYDATEAHLFIEDAGSAILQLKAAGTQNFIESGLTNVNDSSADLIFATVNNITEHMRIQGTTGYVGINQPSPTNELQVGGSAVVEVNMGVSYALYANQIGVDKAIGVTHKIDVDGNTNLSETYGYFVNDNPVVNEDTLGATVLASSLISVGTLTSLAVAGTLDVDGTATMHDIVPEADDVYDLGATGFRFRDLHLGPGSLNIGDNARITNNDGYSLQFVDGENIEQMRFDLTNGRVGIGSTQPVNALDVVGDADVTGVYKVDDVEVLSGVALGDGVLASSLTSVGNLTDLTVVGTSTLGGNVQMNGDLNVAGALTVTGQTTVLEAEQLSVVDPMIRLADNNQGDLFDIGIYGMYHVSPGVTRFTGLIRDAADNNYYLFDGHASEPGVTSVELTNAYATFDLENDRVGLGLGVTAPISALEVGGDIKGDNLQLGSNVYYTTDLAFASGSAFEGTERMRLETGGNLGIGTDAPDTLVHIFSGLNGAGGETDPKTKVFIENGTDAFLQIGVPTNSDCGIILNNRYEQQAGMFYEGNSDRLQLRTGGNVNAISIDDNQNVGLGITQATEKLDVVGNVTASGEYQLDGLSVLSSDTLGSGVLASSLTSVGNLTDLDVAGAVGIGTNAAPADAQLHVRDSGVISGVEAAVKIDVNFADASYINVGGVGRNIGVFNGGNLFMGYNLEYDAANQTYEKAQASPSGGVEYNTVGDVNFVAETSSDATGTEFVATKNMVILNGGNVGIGSTEPVDKLDIVGSMDLSSGNDYKVATNSVLNATTLGNGVVNSNLQNLGSLNQLDVNGDVDISGDLGVTGNVYLENLEVDLDVLIKGGDLNLVDGDEKLSSDGTDLSLHAGGAQRVTILGANGNVGIGDAAPGEALDVVGSINVTSGNAYKIDDVSILTETDLNSSVTQGTGLTDLGILTSLRIGSGTANAGDLVVGDELFVDADVGHCGIGTNVPATRAHIHENSADAEFLMTTTNTGATTTDGLKVTVSNTANHDVTVVNQESGGDMVFRLDDANVMYMDGSNDRVGIGSDTPQDKLDVVGSVRINSNAGANSYKVDGNAVLNVDTLGSGVVNSSLTNLGILTELEVNGTSNLDATNIDGTLTVTGDLNVSGTTFTVNSETLTTTDPMIRLADNNQGDLFDMGFYGHYIETGVTLYRGFIHDSSESKWHIFDGSTVEPGVTNISSVEHCHFVFDSANIRLGVSQTAPISALDVNGDIRGNNLQLGSDLNYETDLLFKTGSAFEGTERMRLETGGNLGIGKTPASGNMLDVAGNANLSSTFAYEIADASVLNATTLGGLVVNSSLTNVGTLTSLECSGTSSFGGSFAGAYDVTVGDANTGLHGAAEDELQVLTGGTERMRFDDSGLVGIGNVDPVQNLQLHEASSGDSIMKFTNTATGVALGNGFDIGLDASENAELRLKETNNMIFYVGDDEKMRVTNAGLVGVGTTPATNLHVAESSNAADVEMRVQNSSDTAGSDAKVLIQVGGTDGGDPHLEMATGANTWSLGVDNSDVDKLKLGLGAVGSNLLMVVDLNGDVGIGTDNPTQRLLVEGNALVRGLDGFDASEELATCYLGDTGHYIRANHSNGVEISSDENIKFFNNGSTQRMVIEDSSGHVGIGTTNPADRLDVQDSTTNLVKVKCTGADTAAFAEFFDSDEATRLVVGIDGATGGITLDNDVATMGTSTASRLQLVTNSVHRMSIESAGNVGIGSSAENPNNLLSVLSGSTSSTANADVVIEAVTATNHAFLQLEAKTAEKDPGLLLTSQGTDAAMYFDESADLLKFSVGASLGTDANRASNTRMTINAVDGNVAIGTDSSTLAKLYVNGDGTNVTPVSYGFLNSSGDTSGASNTNGPVVAFYSIGSSGRIRASEFNAISDKRVKTNLEESSYSDDLETIGKMKTYEYEYIDQKFQKRNPRKGVIAQELEEVYPKAISKCTDFVPNIYKVGSVAGKEISVEFEEHEDIKAGTNVKLMVYKIENDEGEIAIFEIESVENNKLVLVEEFDLNKYYDEMFVIGTEVKDFRNVSNDDILIISVGAIKQLKSENDELKSQMQSILERLEALEQ